MDALTNLMQGTVFTVLTVVIQIIIVFAGAFAISLLKKLELDAGIDIDDKIQSQIEDLIQNVVVYMNQTVVNNMKDSAIDGKLTDEQAEQIFNTVKNSILECLSSDQILHITEKYSGLDEGLKYLIENSVNYNHSLVVNSHTIEFSDNDTKSDSSDV